MSKPDFQGPECCKPLKRQSIATFFKPKKAALGALQILASPTIHKYKCNMTLSMTCFVPYPGEIFTVKLFRVNHYKGGLSPAEITAPSGGH